MIVTSHPPLLNPGSATDLADWVYIRSKDLDCIGIVATHSVIASRHLPLCSHTHNGKTCDRQLNWEPIKILLQLHQIYYFERSSSLGIRPHSHNYTSLMKLQHLSPVTIATTSFSYPVMLVLFHLLNIQCSYFLILVVGGRSSGFSSLWCFANSFSVGYEW